MASHVDNHLDTIFQAMGELKPFTVLQMALMALVGLPAAYQLLSNVFICRDNPHHCASAPNDSFLLLSGLDGYDYDDLSISYQQCHIVVAYNNTVLKTEECIYGMAYDKPKDYSCISQFDLVCDASSLAKLSQTLVFAGQGIGASCFTSLSDRFGRKPVIVTSNFGLLVSGFIIAYAPSYTVFAVFKLAAGAFQQGCFTAFSTIVLEMLTTKNRRFQAFYCGTVWGVSAMTLVLWAYVFREYPWRTLQMAISWSALTFALQLWYGRESLRWLIANGKSKAAESYIHSATRVNKTSLERVKKAYNDACTMSLQGAKDDKHHHNHRLGTATKKLTLLDIMKVKRLFINAVIMWLAWFTTALSLFAIYMTSTSLAGDPYLNYFFITCMEVINNLFLYLSLNRLGRKLTLVSTYFVISTGLILSGVFQTLEQNTVNSVFALIFSCFGMMGASAGFAFVYCYTAELFPTNVRNQALGVSSLVGRAGAMIAPFTGVLSERAKWGPGVMIGGCALVVCLLSIALPETRGRELPQTIEDVTSWFSKKTADSETVEMAFETDESKRTLAIDDE